MTGGTGQNPDMTELTGHVEAGFEAVRDAFAANFAERGDVGATFCLYAGGRVVVDLAGGTTEPGGGGRPYTQDSLQLVFSTTKGATALCAHLLAERGALDLDAPVAEYWPEFAAAGKGEIPVRWLLAHRAGLPAVDVRLTLDEVCAVTPVVEALAAQKPLWEPGTAHGYHALTFGWLVGEVVRRGSGRTVGTFFSDEVAKPLGLDFWIGLPEDLEPRVAPLIQFQPAAQIDPAELERLMASVSVDNLTLRALSLDGAVPMESAYNTRQVHATEMPAANGITNAASLARMYAATIGPVDGVRLLSEATVADACRIQADGPDLVLGMETRFGSGFFLNGGFSPLLSDNSFGHAGAGGSLGFADPAAGVAFGYVMNQMAFDLAGDPRANALIAAVRSCLG